MGTADSPAQAFRNDGAVAQSGERRFCKPEVTGSIPVSSTIPSQRAARAVAEEGSDTAIALPRRSEAGRRFA